MKKNNFLIIGTSIFLLCTNVSSAKKFTDIQEGNKYYIASRYLSEKEVINGYDDNTFKPAQDITRAELLKIIFEGNKTKTTKQNTNCFPDVGYQEWYSKYICTAKELKIISGYDDGNFKPNQAINKAEALKILGEFYKWPTKDNPKQAWYSKYIDLGKTQNLLENPENFDPEENTSRGEISETLYRFLAKTEYNAEKFSHEIENKIAIKINAQDIIEEENNKNTENSTNDDNVISRNLPTPQIIQLAPGEIKIVFSWEMPKIPPEQEKTEFSSYLIEPTDEIIYSEHKIDSKLDTIMESKTNSEIFTIRNLKTDIKETDQIKNYLFFIESLNGETTFNDAKAKIEIYDKKGLVKTITAYQNIDRIWKIFTLDENYEMRIFNSIDTCDQINRESEVCPQGLGE